MSCPSKCLVGVRGGGGQDIPLMKEDLKFSHVLWRISGELGTDFHLDIFTFTHSHILKVVNLFESGYITVFSALPLFLKPIHITYRKHLHNCAYSPGFTLQTLCPLPKGVNISSSTPSVL